LNLIQNTKKQSVKLSIVMMTYNQGKYIKEAIQSILDQSKPFNWELIIGDDCSDDDTEKIISNFLINEKSIIYIRNQHNIGLHKNYESLIKKTSGEYIALLEADDYWVDLEKCLKQIQLLDENPEIAWTFTNSITIDVNGSEIYKTNFTTPKIFDLDYYVINFFNPPSNSIIFRKNSEPEAYPEFFFKIIQWDTALLYLRLLTDQGKTNKIGFINTIGLAWRRHPTATSTTLFSGKQRYLDWITLNTELKKLMPSHLKKHFNKNYVAYEELAILALKNKKTIEFVKFVILLFFNKPNRPYKELKDFFWKIKKQIKHA
jgi:glycosyltransferase involved in cell wall biosynthesis